MNIQLFAMVTAFALLASGCTQQNELEQSKKRIVELETELASLKSKENAQSTTNPTRPKTEGQPKSATAIQPTPSGEQWSYHMSEEKMTGGTTYMASVNSSNTVSFRSPYDGAQNGRLVLRNGKDVMFRIEKGQILCRSYEYCDVLVRFDDGKPETFSGIGSADNSTETVFIKNHEKFLGKLRKSKVVRISLNIYQEGSPVFEFDVSGFSPEKYIPKK